MKPSLSRPPAPSEVLCRSQDPTFDHGWPRWMSCVNCAHWQFNGQYITKRIFISARFSSIKNSHLTGQDLWCLGSKLVFDGSHAGSAASPRSLMGFALIASLNHHSEYETWAHRLTISKTTRRDERVWYVRNAGFIGIFFFQTLLACSCNKKWKLFVFLFPPTLYSFSSLLFFEGLEWGGGMKLNW